MKLDSPTGLLLEPGDGTPSLNNLEEINDFLKVIGAKIWRLDLESEPARIRDLLQQPDLSMQEMDELKNHFLLSRNQLLKLLAEAGRQPKVPGGGELVTHVTNHNYDYPQLYLLKEGVDYSRFDQFHINISDDEISVDEFVQMLHGGSFTVYQKISKKQTLKLTINCPNNKTGWLMTYDGGRPHIGSFSGARLGTKAVVQVIGPAHWTMKYNDSW